MTGFEVRGGLDRLNKLLRDKATTPAGALALGMVAVIATLDEVDVPIMVLEKISRVTASGEAEELYREYKISVDLP